MSDKRETLPDQKLHLAVYINEGATNLAAEFTLRGDGSLWTKRSELSEVGLSVFADQPGDTLIELGERSGLPYRYDAASQSIYITAADSQRKVLTLDASARPKTDATPQRDFGAIVNYSAYAATNTASSNAMSRLNFLNRDVVANMSIDARAFSPVGTLSMTGLVGDNVAVTSPFLRLETSWALSDPEEAITYRIGDTIAGGLSWSRPYRIAGVQIQRNFGLRPDIVNAALPSFAGSAAAPSMVDVYVNGLKTYSQEVASGPFEIKNVPVISGAGEARVVVRDSSGRQVETKQSFFTSPHLLGPGQLDYSMEVGVPRIGYGVTSNDYLNFPVGSGSVRGGVYDWLTLLGYTEAAPNLANIGGGAAIRLGDIAVLSLGAQGSYSDGKTGLLGYAAIDAQRWGLSFHASSQRVFGDYEDIASITQAAYLKDIASVDSRIGLLTQRSAKQPRALETASIGIPLQFDASSLSLSYIHVDPVDAAASHILSASYSRPIFGNGSLFVSGFTDLANRDNSGIFAGVSFPLDGGVTATAAVSASNTGATGTVEAVKSLGLEPGSYGWRVRDSEGANPDRVASVAYRSSAARMEGTVWQNSAGVQGSAQVDGAVIATRSGVYLANQVNDAFAIVEVGVPDVAVLYENRLVGRTGADGTLFIPGLRSFEANKLEIDARTLPEAAEVGTTTKRVVPADRGGVIVDFRSRSAKRSGIVIVKRKDGKFPEVGSAARLIGETQDTVVGYDGRIYISALAADNVIEITEGANVCRAHFALPAKSTRQAVIGPLLCE